MSGITLHVDEIRVSMRSGPDVADLTPALAGVVHRSGIVEGSLHATSIGSTGSLTTLEFEPGAVADLKRAIERLAPADARYAHEETWHDGNGHSHVQAALLGPSLVLPIRDGRLALGTWQQVVLVNHDNGPRERAVAVTVIGHGPGGRASRDG